MKWYIGEVQERNGDFEYTDKFLFQAENPNLTLNRIAMTWRGGINGFEDDAWWCEGTLMSGYSVKEVPEHHIEVLKKYIPDLTGYISRYLYLDAWRGLPVDDRYAALKFMRESR